MKTPIEITEPWPTTTPSTTSERAPMKQSSSMIVGPACSGSRTPPMPTPPERWTFLPIWAQEPTVAQVSTMVPVSTRAPRLTKEGISTTFGAMKAERRTTQPGTARKPALSNSWAPQPSNFEGTLSHQAGRAGAALDDAHRGEAEGQQHRLLQPLMHHPGVADLLGDADLALVEQVERGFHRLAHGALGGDVDLRALFEGVVDDLFEGGEVGGRGGHRAFPFGLGSKLGPRP